MKIKFDSELTETQKFTCSCCAHCCRGFLVPVTQKERNAIADLRDWPSELKVQQIYIRTQLAGPAGYALAKRPDGRCVFLDSDNLCLIHKRYSPAAKPIACQLYPFVFTPTADQLPIALRFDCPAVCKNQGQLLTEYQQQLQTFADQLIPKNANFPIPNITPKRTITAKNFIVVNNAVLKIIISNAIPLNIRLHWLASFIDHLLKLNWKNVTEKELPEILDMLRTGLFVELANYHPDFKQLTGRAKKHFSQYLFILSQPSQNPTLKPPGIFNTLRGRIKQARVMTAFSNSNAQLPQTHPDWPSCKIAELEKSFGPITSDIDSLLTRFFTNRVATFNYCGPNLYNYSIIQGLQTLIIATAAAAYLMRIYAIKANRAFLVLSDIQSVLKILDGNLGYAKALNFGPAQSRLETTAQYIPQIINATYPPNQS